MELKRHPSLLFANEFQSLCRPLFKLGIDFFSHLRVTGNHLCANGSNPDYFRFYFENELQHFDIQTADFNLPQRYVLWDKVEKRGKALELYQTEKAFGIDHIFTIIENAGEGQHYYSFGVEPHKIHMNAFYYEHLDLLEQFISYYKDTLLLNNHLNRAYDMDCVFKSHSDNYLIKDSSLSQQLVEDYLHSIKRSPPLKPILKLSRREMQCALHLLDGKTAAEIATLLTISPRTVEVYLARLKSRFGSKNKFQLAKHLMESGLIK